MKTLDVPQNVLNREFDSKPEDWHQHANGGGWVHKTATVEEKAYLHPSSIVYGDARVSGDARVYEDAWVSGNAQVYGNAWVSGNARVSGNAWEFSPMYIQGSRHALTLCSLKQIAVGCHVHDIKEWLSNYESIGKREGYSPSQIAEYGAHLKYLAAAAKRIAKDQKTAKKEVTQ